MSLKLLCLALIFFGAALCCQDALILWAHRFGVGQAIKDYGPAAHIKKSGTPSMGGAAALALTPFLVVSSYLAGTAELRDMAALWVYPVICALVGLADDLLKLRSKSGDGFSSLGKLFLQLAVTMPWAWWVASGGVYLMPWIPIPHPYGFALLSFLGVGIMNAVNVTDGLDGLAASAMILSLCAVMLLSDVPSAKVSSVAGLAILAAFLWHNANPAELFMGDVGAHLWAGLLLSLCVESHFVMFVFPLAFLFGVEIITVAIQIFAIRGFGKKVFRMSPLHHHFELCGWREPKIVARFCLAHLAGMVALLIFLLTIFELYGGRY
ncbi:MAG: phospho-N-acetylmuramoyl-pentapeptide-transferase [Synergistaceae bacterium]|jgi:phospho-N-acetylmuramoyl-pentapeptide-transferase|nr:phospho-N-acetylmuramoyl-pentapeptide-transferase [Synergistaceae bacterium]